ncbi:FecR domain-containing protein [Roseateles cellulosilyticus]|uniref:FecR domain-containing protein n=1 Tax=Pelomonas cellulosilytica TaxID=2906762 RepID=A0ABS8XXB1_9BURK|nr:FecR domain-containing protein [Pelomonas sp. P8]MCE4557297.1 FecR domain-containing protein [Pelomonas sp. P8]
MNARKTWLAAGLLWWSGWAFAQTEAADADWRYRVQPGDTLITLTQSWLAPPRGWRDLQQLNRVADPLHLMPGRTLRMPVAWLRREASVAEAVFVKGEVQRQRGATAEPLAAGTTLLSGDRLRTGPQASVSVRFADGSRLLVPPQSEVTLEQLLVLGRGALPAVRVGVGQGGADHRVQPNPQRVPLYEVNTPHVNLGVRGTEFRVQTAGGASRMQVISGAVHADGLAADVTPGQGLLAEGKARSVGPLLPAPDLAAVPATSERLPLRLGWAASPAGAQAWRAQLYARGDFDRLMLDARVTEPVAAWPEARELPDGDYTLRVRAIDARGQEGAAADANVHLQARPEPPFIQAPVDGAVSYAGGMAFAWTRNTAAPAVQLQIARDTEFKDIALQTPPLDAAGHEVRLPDGAYHWRIAAVEAGGRAGPFGDAQRFEIRPPPPAPPPAEPDLSGDQIQLRWRADQGVVRYELEWARTDAFDGAEVQRFSADQPAIALPKPSAGTYFLRARAFNAAGAASPWGQTQRIDVPYPRWLWLLPLLLVPLF